VETVKIELKVFFAAVITVLIVEFAMGFVAAGNPSHKLLVLGVARITETGGIILSVVYFGKGMSAIGMAAPAVGSGIIRGGIWCIGFGMMAALAGMILYFLKMDPIALVSSKLPEKIHELFLIFLVGGVIGPVAEEVFFRGICYGFFRRWGITLAVVLTTAVFVLAHSIKSAVPLPQIIGGIVFALAYEKEKNLMVPITIHVLGNLAIFTLSVSV